MKLRNFTSVISANFVCTLQVFLLVFSGAATARAETYISYQTLIALPAAELATANVKLTYMGRQLHMVPSIVFYVSGDQSHPELFAPYYRTGYSGVRYENDMDYYEEEISASELTSVLSNVGTLPTVTDGDVTDRPWLSISILVRLPTVRVFDSVLNSEETHLLLDQLRTALVSNSDASGLLLDEACDLGMLNKMSDQYIATSAASTSVHLSGFRRDATSSQFYATATITNTSTLTTLPSPLSLVVSGLQPNASLENRSGATCATTPRGLSYINVPISPPGLGPGQTVDVVLEIDNHNDAELNLSGTVLAGPGDR